MSGQAQNNFAANAFFTESGPEYHGFNQAALQQIDKAGLDARLTDAAKDWERLRKNLAATIFDDWVRTEMAVPQSGDGDILIVAEYLRERIIFEALSQGRDPSTSPE